MARAAPAVTYNEIGQVRHAEKGRSAGSLAKTRVSVVPVDHRAVFEFTKGDDVSPHIVYLCRKYGVTPQEVVHQFMRSEEMPPALRAQCAKWLLDELKPKKDAEQGSASFTVVINHVTND